MYVCRERERERESAWVCARAYWRVCVLNFQSCDDNRTVAHPSQSPSEKKKKLEKQQAFGNNCFVSVLQLCPTGYYCLLLFRSCANANVCVTGLWFQLSLLRKLAIRARKRIQILTVETPATHLSCRVQPVLPHARVMLATLALQAVIVVSYNYF